MNASTLFAQPTALAPEPERKADEWTGTLGAFWAWREFASCRDLESSVFFSPDGERGHARRSREAGAKAVCARCPVQDACADYALSNHEPYGVWGGLSESERDTIWRGQRRHAPTAPRRTA